MEKKIVAITDWTVVEGWNKPVRIYMFEDGSFATNEFTKAHSVGDTVTVSTARKGKLYTNTQFVK